MTDKEKRHQVENREEFTQSQRDAIAAKSDNKCAWCGKKVYFKYGGTVDHYIPLRKGGTNDPVNLVLMCEACNQKKASLIVPPYLGARHLKDEEYAKLDDWFDQYIDSYEYLSRGNLLACDMYAIDIYLPQVLSAGIKQVKKGKFPSALARQMITCILQRVYPKDEDRILDYYIRYLKRYKVPYDDETAQKNIEFWMRFGAIYFIERQGEIQLMLTIVMNKHHYFYLNLFPFYSNDMAANLCNNTIRHLGKALLKEQHIPVVNLFVAMLNADTLTDYFFQYPHRHAIDDVTSGVCYKIQGQDFDGDEQEALKSFYNKFSDVEQYVQNYLDEYDTEGYLKWMAEEVIGERIILGDSDD